MIATACRRVFDRVLDVPCVFNAARYLLVADQSAARSLIQSHLRPAAGDRVLDVCCGLGLFAESAGEARYAGVDLSEGFVRAANSRYADPGRRAFFVGDATRLPCRDKAFDHAIVVNAMHHFSGADVTRVLREIRRVTRRRVAVIDASRDVRNPLSQILIRLDRGKFMRREPELLDLIEAVMPVAQVKQFDVGLYREMLFCCEIEHG